MQRFTDTIDQPHRLLLRQLRKLALEDAAGFGYFRDFVAVVNESYVQADRERRFLENALEVTAQELTGVNKQLKLFIENAPTGIAMLDNQLRYLYASRRWLEDRKILHADITGMNHFDLFPTISQRRREIHQRCLQGESAYCEEDKILLSDGSLCWIRWEIRPWFNTDASVGGLIIFSEDITEKKLASDELRIASVAFQSKDGMLVTGNQGDILRSNDAFEKLLGYSSEDLVGKNTSLFSCPLRHDAAFYRNMWEAISSEGKWEGAIWNRHKEGHTILCWLSISAVRSDNGKITHFIGIYSKATDPKEAERKIIELAYYDPLTNLPNRRLLLDRIDQVRISASRNKNIGAILLIDVDRFKSINDTRGHDVGDHVLVYVAKALRYNLREIDTAARLGGDEFVVLISDLGQDLDRAISSLKSITDKLLASIAKPISFNGHTFQISVSIGISVFSDTSKETSELLKEADLALYKAKADGRNTARFFDVSMHHQLMLKSNLESGLKLALKENLFLLHYQPQVDEFGKCVGAEALLRWMPAEGEVVAPDVFIPVAEESGLIIPMGQWVLRAACQQLVVWSGQEALRHISLSVNVSAMQFMHPDFATGLKSILQSTGANPRLLKLELTESLLLDNVESVIARMRDLKSLGITFSIDDFGTGYSSLNYLKLLPLDEIKLDRSFVSDLTHSDGARAIIHSIISLAQVLRLNIVAEGVETQAQRDFLLAEGCHSFQGYLFGRPVPVEEFVPSLQGKS
jgi:diguanylate cyclase (GGDEF)-like protein/PAS domain S-box-containing protein